MKNWKIGLIFLLFSFQTTAQNPLPPFWNDIQVFKKQDSLRPPIVGQILFIGSSSFTRWTDVQASFPEKKIVNRAFGGSTLDDQIRYFETIVRPCRPRQIVIYCGENDFANDENATVEPGIGKPVRSAWMTSLKRWPMRLANRYDKLASISNFMRLSFSRLARARRQKRVRRVFFQSSIVEILP